MRDADRIARRDDLDGLDDVETIVEDPAVRHAKSVLTFAVLAVGLALIVALIVFAQPRGQVFVERWPNGYRRTETHYISSTNAAGRVEHGQHRAWHANGALAVEGEYDHGEPVGMWRYYDEAGGVEGMESQQLPSLTPR